MNRLTLFIDRPLIAGLLAAAIASCAPTVPAAGPAVIPELVGRTAGTPQSCVSTQQMGALRIADGGVLLYDSGRTIWVNRLADRCPGMNRNQILVVELHGSQYCRGDWFRTLDPPSHILGPGCILGDFVPYTR